MNTYHYENIKMGQSQDHKYWNTADKNVETEILAILIDSNQLDEICLCHLCAVMHT